MLTEQQYANVVFTASRANAVLTQSIRNKEALGCYPKWGTASCQSLKIKSGIWSLAVQDYSSVASVDIYNQLLDIGSTWTGGIIFDPNYNNPTSPIVIVQGGAFGYVKSPNIVFTNQTVISLTNWQTVYAPLYGQNPSIEIFTNQGGIDQKDTQTEPIYLYATPGDPSTALQSITFSYIIPTTGYYTISGTIPGATQSGGISTGGSFFIIIPYNSPNITYNGSGNFVYTDLKLIGKSGYFAMSTQLTQDLVDGTDIISNPALGNFTIINPPGFVLLQGSFLIVLVQ